MHLSFALCSIFANQCTKAMQIKGFVKDDTKQNISYDEARKEAYNQLQREIDKAIENSAKEKPLFKCFLEYELKVLDYETGQKIKKLYELKNSKALNFEAEQKINYELYQLKNSNKELERNKIDAFKKAKSKYIEMLSAYEIKEIADPILKSFKNKIEEIEKNKESFITPEDQEFLQEVLSLYLPQKKEILEASDRIIKQSMVEKYGQRSQSRTKATEESNEELIRFASYDPEQSTEMGVYLPIIREGIKILQNGEKMESNPINDRVIPYVEKMQNTDEYGINSAFMAAAKINQKNIETCNIKEINNNQLANDLMLYHIKSSGAPIDQWAINLAFHEGMNQPYVDQCPAFTSILRHFTPDAALVDKAVLQHGELGNVLVLQEMDNYGKCISKKREENILKNSEMRKKQMDQHIKNDNQE